VDFRWQTKLAALCGTDVHAIDIGVLGLLLVTGRVGAAADPVFIGAQKRLVTNARAAQSNVLSPNACSTATACSRDLQGIPFTLRSADGTPLAKWWRPLITCQPMPLGLTRSGQTPIATSAL
jgi:hypothetical protein